MSSTFQCEFCTTIFISNLERDDHIKEHFKQKYCKTCDKLLIQIGDNWYELVLHLDDNCNYMKQDENTHFDENIVKIEPIEIVEFRLDENIAVADVDSSLVNKSLVDEKEELDTKVEQTEAGETLQVNSLPELPGTSENIVETEQATREAECDICQMTFSTKHSLKRHLKKGSHRFRDVKKSLECEICQKEFSSVRNLCKHNRRGKHRANQFKCQICNKLYKTRDNFKNHIREMHQGKRYSCEYCGTLFVKQAKLECHRANHLAEYSITCDICKKQFKHKNNLIGHMKKHIVKTVKCDLCTKEFKSSTALNDHIQFIHEGKSFCKCEICGIDIRNKAAFRKHMALHTGHRRYICSFCGKQFHEKCVLDDHLNTHTGAKPYVCKVCNKAFSRSSSLCLHKRIHSGEKPYQCEIEGCDAAYAYSIDLKRHRYSVHGIYTKKHICPICSKVYSENKLLKKHLESHE